MEQLDYLVPAGDNLTGSFTTLPEPFDTEDYAPSSSPDHEVPILPLCSSPPSSPPLPHAEHDPEKLHATPLKRKAEPVDTTNLPPSKRQLLLRAQIKPHPSLSTPFKPPLPVTGKATQFKSPFAPGSTLAHQKSRSQSGTSSSSKLSSTPISTHATRLRNSESSFANSSSPSSKQHKSKTSTSASRPFKSPVIKSSSSKGTSAAASSSTSSSSSLASSLRIAALEKKLQILKQATRIKSENSEMQLVDLVKKWKRAARDASEDLWMTIKDSGEWGSGGGGGDGGGNGGNWGYGDDDKSKDKDKGKWGWDEANQKENGGEEEDLEDSFTPPSPSVLHRHIVNALNKPGPSVPRRTLLHATEERQARWSRDSSHDDAYGAQDEDGYPVDAPEPEPVDVAQDGEKGDGAQEEEEDEKKPEWNLGAMLTSMGIPPASLGWDDEEGEFVDT